MVRGIGKVSRVTLPPASRVAALPRGRGKLGSAICVCQVRKLEFTFGDLVQLNMLDTRTYRSPHPCCARGVG